MSNFLEKAVNHSIWTSIGAIANVILGFLFAGVTIRWLGESEAGFVITINTLLAINNNLSNLGLGSASIHLISKAYSETDNERIKKIAGVCFLTSIGFGLLGLFIFSLGSTFIIELTKYEDKSNFGVWYCILSGLSFLIINICNYCNTLITSIQRFDLQTILNTIFGLANGILGIIFISLFPNILTVGLIYFLVFTLRLIITINCINRSFGFIPKPSWDKTIFLNLWSFGKWSYLESILRIFSFGLDKILVTVLFGSANVPAYVLPQTIYLNIHNIINQQCSYLFPMLSNLRDVKVIERITERYRWFIGVIAGLIYSLLILLGKDILSTLVNPDFSEKAYMNLFIFSIIGIFHALGIVNYQLSYAKGDSKSNFYYLYWNAILCLPTMFLLGKVFGYNYVVLGQLALIISTYLHYLRIHELNFFSGFTSFFKPHFSVLFALISLILLAFYSYNYLLINSTILNLSIFAISIVMYYLLIIFILEKIGENFDSRIGTIISVVNLLYKKLR